VQEFAIIITFIIYCGDLHLLFIRGITVSGMEQGAKGMSRLTVDDDCGNIKESGQFENLSKTNLCAYVLDLCAYVLGF
jgi:hypothetical protein